MPIRRLLGTCLWRCAGLRFWPLPVAIHFACCLRDYRNEMGKRAERQGLLWHLTKCESKLCCNCKGIKKCCNSQVLITRACWACKIVLSSPGFVKRRDCSLLCMQDSQSARRQCTSRSGIHTPRHTSPMSRSRCITSRTVRL